jgi:hypothetical protein
MSMSRGAMYSLIVCACIDIRTQALGAGVS